MMFSTVSRLGLTVPSVFGESATSFAARLARRNGAPRLIPFCSDMGVDHRALTNGNETEILRLAALAGVDPGPLLFWTPRLLAPGWFKLGHERVKFTAFARTRIRTCPNCLSEGPDAHAAIWQLRSIRRCAEHGRLLVNLPVSHASRGMFDYAFHVAQLGMQELDAVPAPESSLEAYLLGRIMRGPGQAWIDQLPFHVAAQTCENFGALTLLGPDAARDKMTDSEWQQAGAIGFSILKQGPQALSEKLKELQRASLPDIALYRRRGRRPNTSRDLRTIR